MEQPQPRVALGMALRGIATSAIDVSDGLLGDLAHVLRRSNVGAEVWADALPRSAALRAMPLGWQRECTLAGGDDYELVFTAPPQCTAQVIEAARSARVEVTRIGSIGAAPGLRLLDRDGQALANSFGSFDHFKT
jgi:thiamine-monophosphate kinase